MKGDDMIIEFAAASSGRTQKEYNEDWNGGDFFVERKKNGEVHTNVPRIAGGKSDCYDWGYGGAGPADLALNILLHFTGDEDFSTKYYHQLKWDIISGIPDQGGRIGYAQLRQWVHERNSNFSEDDDNVRPL